MASILRLAGTFDHPNNLAMYLNFIFPICGYYWLIEKRARVKFWIGVAIFLAVLAELGSGSRGGWLAIATAVTITAIFWLKKQGKNPVFGIGGMAVALVLIFGVLMAASETFRTRLTEGDAGTAEIRYPLMEVAQTMIEQNPYLGVGLANYTLEMRKYDYTNKQVTKDYDQPVHNTFMLLAAETGIPTLIFMAMLYLVWIKDSLLVFLRAKGVTAVVGIGVLAMLIGWVVHNQVNLSAPYDDVTLWILVGMVAAASRMARENKQIQTQR
jgi:O-antigen ligase